MEQYTSDTESETRGSTRFHDHLSEILDNAIEVDGAVKGTVQLFDQTLDGLRIIGQRGFDPAFLELFNVVRADDFCVCGRALRHQRRVVCHDILADRLYSPYLATAVANGIRAVQSTPVIGDDGLVRGIFSTHFAKVHFLSRQGGHDLDQIAAKMASLFREHYPEQVMLPVDRPPFKVSPGKHPGRSICESLPQQTAGLHDT